MDAEKVDVLLKTVKIGSMKTAAYELNYTQSGLLYMINSLENELGVSVLTRTRKGIFLNETGKALLPYFESLVHSNNLLLQKAEEYAQIPHQLRIGVLPCVSGSVFPEILKRFMEKRPEISIDVKVVIMDMAKNLALENIDVAILPKYAAGEYNYYHLISTYFCAAVPEDEVAEGQTAITIEEFEQHPIIFSAYNPENAVFMALTQRDIRKQVKCSVLDGTPLLAMVEQKLGATYLSALYQNECPPHVKMLPFVPTYPYDIGLIVRPEDEKKPMIIEFISTAQECCKGLS